jgi:hypothetical protein
MESNYDYEKNYHNNTLAAYFKTLIVKVSIPLCLLLNKPHLFSLTQHRFVLIQLVNLPYMQHVSAYT